MRISPASAGASTTNSAVNADLLPDGPAPNKMALTRVVGLGASAGGLEALQQFLGNVPPASGLAYIVVQHLDPTHKAMLTELLQRSTAMPVREATGSMRVIPDAVFVIPPSTELTLVGGRLHLTEPAQPRGRRLPIDVLFSSLARDQGERAIGVVLSGMGSDGTVGLQAIKGAGGLTFAQEPASAQFDSMPKSAIDAGACDIVAAAEELPHRILLVAAKHPVTALGSAATDEDSDHSLNVILGLLRERSKHDLTLYKITTVKRRIERRMSVHGRDTLTGYRQFVQENPQELDLLFKELLIGVTSFFRDPPLWRELKDTVLPALLARCTPGSPMRAWVVGCSTGEEAYSLAMTFREVADSQPNPDAWALQIFASDVNADAIAAARRGQFSSNIAVDVAPERLSRFFHAMGDGFLIGQEIRQTILFAQHDVTLDPPFTRLDILSCRNLMIYFNAALQQRVLPLFHYVMRPGGVLILGGSETVGRSLSLFTPLDSKSRIYLRSAAAAVTGNLDFPVNRSMSSRTTALESNVSQPVNRQTNLLSLANQVLLQEFSPPAVLVNEQGDVIYINGHTGKYLEPAAGKANWNIHVMARPAIRTQLAAAMRQALQEKRTIELRGLRLDEDPQSTLNVTVQPQRESPGLEGTVMIVFHNIAIPPAAMLKRRRAAGSLDPAISDDLARAREEIRALRQEMHASQEELQSSNEELQSTNEELQSANEELTTSKEESQSMNEELQTINVELRSKLDDLALAQSDMQNLLNSTDIATLFLDNELNVRRFTEHITRIIQLRDGDIGRPLSDLASTLIYPQLHADANGTLRTLAFSEKQIATTDAHWYTVRIMPYRTVANVIQGVVITFVDITAAKELESRLRKP
jgi:two-component system, chemotaxis family, CheB/CheR fusion protein